MALPVMGMTSAVTMTASPVTRVDALETELTLVSSSKAALVYSAARIPAVGPLTEPRTRRTREP